MIAYARVCARVTITLPADEGKTLMFRHFSSVCACARVRMCACACVRVCVCVRACACVCVRVKLTLLVDEVQILEFRHI